jgi:hypothetical protein
MRQQQQQQMVLLLLFRNFLWWRPALMAVLSSQWLMRPARGCWLQSPA